MKCCAESPSNYEYSLCGNAWDAPDTEDDQEAFEFATPGNRVTCEECLTAIAEIHAKYTASGRYRTN